MSWKRNARRKRNGRS